MSESSFSPRREKFSKKSKKDKSLFQELLSTFLYIIVITGIFLSIRLYVVAPVSVEGASMEPTLEDQDRLLLNKIADIERFDIIVFPEPNAASTGSEKNYIKRVIGMPGDEISFQDQTLYVNGDPVDEEYIDLSEVSDEDLLARNGNFNLASLQGVEKVPEDSFFVLGDNRVNSQDSRSFGFISRDSVTGKTNLRIWPLDRFGFINED